jgi:RNA polymerase sigma-70 factor (ECF subfamily)
MMGVMAEPLPMKLETGAECVTRLQDFGGWMMAEQRRILLLCHHLLQDRDEAASAAQDAFLKAYRACSKGGASGIDNPAAWLTRIAVNGCLDRLRSRRWRFWQHRKHAGGEALLARAADSRPDAEDRVMARQIAERLTSALDRLSMRQRAVFTLKHFEDRSLEEIGVILGLETGTVKAHLSRALAKLRNELQDLYALHRR